jgi:hypothetical protein
VFPFWGKNKRSRLAMDVVYFVHKFIKLQKHTRHISPKIHTQTSPLINSKAALRPPEIDPAGDRKVYIAGE